MTQVTEAMVKMAAQLYEMRDTAKLLLGDKYKARMMELGMHLQDAAKQAKKEPLAIVIEAGANHRITGMDLVVMMAAAVELTEPTT